MKDFSYSVIIPSFNCAKYLTRAIESVLSQTCNANEIILIDDGSTDQTKALIEKHYQNQIRYHYQNNQGVSAARNTGIKMAFSKWIAFLDSDDAWHPKKIATQAQQLQTNSELLISHTNEVWYRHGEHFNQHKKHQKKGGFIYEHCLPRCAISPSSVLIHRAVLNKVGLFDETLPACEDYDLWLRITSQFEIGYIDKRYTIKYGGHEDQLSQRYWGMDRFRIQALDKILQSKTLNDQQIASTQLMLNKKIAILKKGAIKHHNKELLQWIATINIPCEK